MHSFSNFRRRYSKRLFARPLATSSTPTGAGGKPSTWFPPGGLVELTPANPCTRTPEQTHIHTDTRKSRSTIPHQQPHACKQDDSAASKTKSGAACKPGAWVLLCLLCAAARRNLRLPRAAEKTTLKFANFHQFVREEFFKFESFLA